MAKIPIILEPGRADGKLVSSGAIFDENKGMFQSEINDIQDTLNSDNSNKPLSAKQGKVLKELLNSKVIEVGAVPIDTEPTEGNTTHIVSSDGIHKALEKKVNNVTFEERNKKQDQKLSKLEDTTSEISKEVIKTKDDFISIEDNNGNKVFYLDENGLNAKNVKSNGKDVLTEHHISVLATKKEVDNKQDKIPQISQNTTTSDEEEQSWESDDEREKYASIGSYGIKAKGFFDLDGNPIVDDKDKYAKYMDVNYNTGVLAPFLLKYLNKETDEFGQLTIHLCGDSIFGRQDKGATWNPSNPEMSLTPDMNSSDETQPGYITGHFPPNAWEQLVCYRLIKYLQYGNAGVKYYNHVASEVTKSGTWNDLFPAGADSLRLCSSSISGNSISLSFSGAKFAKFIVSNYGGAIDAATIKVEISDDGGVSFKTPADAGITESHDNSGVSGEHKLLDLRTIKFAQFCWAGFNVTKSYIIKVTHTNSSILRVWGFETWVNKRINIIDCAEGGNTASAQNGTPRRFWNSNSKPSLVIYELPYLNDLGTAIVSGSLYKSKAYLTTNPGTVADKTTYYCEDTGFYTYFNVTASHGDYMSYNATLGKWVLGSPYLESKMHTYYTEVKTSLERIKRIGIPILCIITHEHSNYTRREFSPMWGAPILRGLTKELGFATIDINAYQHDLKEPNSLTKSPADGVHLNDVGSATYTEMIAKCLPLVIPNSIGTSKWDNGVFYGTSNSTGNIKFDGNIECNKVPLITVLDNPNIVISNITNKGFIATGSGSFSYKVIVNL